VNFRRAVPILFLISLTGCPHRAKGPAPAPHHAIKKTPVKPSAPPRGACAGATDAKEAAKQKYIESLLAYSEDELDKAVPLMKQAWDCDPGSDMAKNAYDQMVQERALKRRGQAGH
jgi:hypothetical protein